jgi:hypothetical protein
MEWRGKAGGRRPGAWGGRDGRLRIIGSHTCWRTLCDQIFVRPGLHDESCLLRQVKRGIFGTQLCLYKVRASVRRATAAQPRAPPGTGILRARARALSLSLSLSHFCLSLDFLSHTHAFLFLSLTLSLGRSAALSLSLSLSLSRSERGGGERQRGREERVGGSQGTLSTVSASAACWSSTTSVACSSVHTYGHWEIVLTFQFENRPPFYYNQQQSP